MQKNVVIGMLKEYRTKRLAKRAMERLLSRVNDPGYRPGRVATIGEFAERWKADILERQKPSARQSAESHLRAYIVPFLGKVRLDNLGVENQQVFVNQLSGKVSRTTIENILATLSSMLNTAKSWGYICENIVLKRLVLPPRGIRQQARAFTSEQAGEIIQLSVNPYRLMFAIAAYTGIRAGEIMGLPGEDVGLERGILTVRQSSWAGQIQAPKSQASENSIPIPAPLLKMLKAYIPSLAKRDFEGVYIRTQGLLFVNGPTVQWSVGCRKEAVAIVRCPQDSTGRIPRISTQAHATIGDGCFSEGNAATTQAYRCPVDAKRVRPPD